MIPRYHRTPKPEPISVEQATENALRLMTHAGQRLAELLGEAPTQPLALEPDGLTMTIAFPTLGFALHPLARTMVVRIAGSVESRTLTIPDCQLHGDQIDVVLGMLEQSRRRGKGARAPASVNLTWTDPSAPTP